MLNDQAILHLTKAHPDIIYPFEMSLLQGHSYDCLLDRKVQVPTQQVIKGGGVKKTWTEKDIVDNEVYMHKGDFFLGSTIEYLRLPDNIAAIVCGKSTVGRNGLQIECAGFIDAGFSGNITLELFNMAPWSTKLVYKTPYCQLRLFSVESPVYRAYRDIGHYNGQTGPTAPHKEI